MNYSPLRRLVASLGVLLAVLILVSGLGFAVGVTRPLVSGAISVAPPLDDRGVSRVLLPAGRYQRYDAAYGSVEAQFCGPRLLLGVRDGDWWFLSDGYDYSWYHNDPRIEVLERPAQSIHVRIALYTDPGSADAVSIAAAQASIREFFPLYAALYTGGALSVEIEDAGELTPSRINYSTQGIDFVGPDLLELRRVAGDDRIGLLLTPDPRHEHVRGLTYLDPLDARPGIYVAYTSWFRKAEFWHERTGRTLDQRLSLADLSGRELLEFLAETPEEINDPAVVAWHELLHVIEMRSHPAFLVHDWNEYGHNGVQEPAFEETRSVERSWYGIASWAALGEPLVERSEPVSGCIEPMAYSVRR